jgi:hypothetical protein
MTRHYESSNPLTKIEKDFLVDERLLWLGKPSVRRLLTMPHDGFEPLVGLVIGIIITLVAAVILLTGMVEITRNVSILLVGLLFAVVTMPLVIQIVIAKNTTYAVTTHRALILKGSKLTSFGAGDINRLEYSTGKDGTGDILFKVVIHERMIPVGYLSYPVEYEEQIGFFGISRPRLVYGMLLHTFRTSPISFWQEVESPAEPRQLIAHA